MTRLFIKWMMLMLKYTYEIRREVLYANIKIQSMEELSDRGDEIEEYSNMIEILNTRYLHEKQMKDDLDKIPYGY